MPRHGPSCPCRAATLPCRGHSGRLAVGQPPTGQPSLPFRRIWRGRFLLPIASTPLRGIFDCGRPSPKRHCMIFRLRPWFPQIRFASELCLKVDFSLLSPDLSCVPFLRRIFPPPLSPWRLNPLVSVLQSSALLR